MSYIVTVQGSNFNQYSVNEVATMLGVSVKTIRRWIDTNKIETQPHEYHCSIFITPKQLNSFLFHNKKYADRLKANKSAYMRFKRDLAHSINVNLPEMKKQPRAEEPKEVNASVDELSRNSSHCVDPTPYEALYMKKSGWREAKMLKQLIYQACNIAGFEVKSCVVISKDSGIEYKIN